MRKLKQTHYALYTSPNFLKLYGHPKLPKELSGMRSIGIMCNDQVYKWLLIGPDKKRQEITHKPVLIADDWLIIKEAVLNGIGISILPEHICQDEIKMKRLIKLLPAYTLPQAKLYVVYPSRRGQVSAVRRFIDFLSERIEI